MSTDHRGPRALAITLGLTLLAATAGHALAADAVPIVKDEIVDVTASSHLPAAAPWKAHDGRTSSAWVSQWRKGKGAKRQAA